MCEPATLSAVAAYAALAGAGISAYGMYQQGRTQKQVAERNAVVAGYAADDAIRRGDEAAARARRNTSQLAGVQRATMAAKGLDLGVGTPGDILEDTNFFGQTDEDTARTNARREAWGLRAQQGSFQAQADSINPGVNAGLSLLGSAGGVADRWYTYRKG